MTPGEAALRYLDEGLAPIPVPFRSKNPSFQGWQKLKVTPETVGEYFPTGRKMNVGIRLGAPSNGVSDVDCDSLDSISIAEAFLPNTRRFGRPQKPKSHVLVRVPDWQGAGQIPFKD